MERIILTREDCCCDLVQLYENIALKSGFDSEYLKDATFNCTRIRVTTPVMDEVFRHYKEDKGASDFDMGFYWVMYGPKADLPGDGFVAKIEEDFISVEIPQF